MFAILVTFLLLQLGIIVHGGEEAWWQEQEADSSILSASKKQESKLELGQAFYFQSLPSDILPPAWRHYLPKQHQQLETKSSKA